MVERPTIFCMTTMHEAGMGPLRSAAGRLVMATRLDDAAILRAEVAAADPEAIVCRTHGDIDGPLMDRAPRLRVVGRHGVGVDQIDVDAATERGVLVVTTPGANTEAVCQHTFAFLIGLSKHFPQQMAALKAGRYHDRTKRMGRDLTGRTLGIVGFGRIGRRVGAVAAGAFGMRVLYTDVVPGPPEAEDRAGGARRVELDQLLAESEYVTLHVPLDSTTRRLIDARSLGLMRTDAILVNTCRGPVVDESAVAAALDAGTLAGYAADVFEAEPPPADHPLIGRDDVMLTPHSAAQTEESLRNMASWVAEDVVAVLDGRPPARPYNDPVAVIKRRAALGKPPLWA